VVARHKWTDNYIIGEPDAPSEEEKTEAAYFVGKSLTQLSDKTSAINQNKDASTIFLYSATKQERVFAEHNGQYWGSSELSPIKIPVGAVTANLNIPSDMRYGGFVAKQHDTQSDTVQIVIDTGWITDGRAVDVSGYNDGYHYFAANIVYNSWANIPADFDTSVFDFYFADANGNRMP
jgi:hypothetical protein